MPDGSTILCRRKDMVTLVLEGGLPMPMLQAAQKMIDMPEATPFQRVEALGGDNGRSLMDVLRNHACDVALDPKITHTDTGDPNALPVGMLSTTELLAIWTETAVIPVVGPDAAAEFRPAASAPADLPAPHEPDLQPTAQPVAGRPDIELVVNG
jgi:hypothetical protein